MGQEACPEGARERTREELKIMGCSQLFKELPSRGAKIGPGAEEHEG